jgi:spermidine/putrescine transport system substrate-binding protein
MLTEMRDTVPLILQSEGINPDEATKEDWLAAIDKLREARDSGQIRRFTGNEYTEDLTSGNIVAAIGWSGDASLIENPNAEWRVPTQGCTQWSENMVIPVGAPNTPAAIAFMNFVYQPEIAVGITEYVEYISPVKGVKELLEKNGSELADSPIVFPTEQFTAKCTGQNTPEDLEEVNEAWQEVIAG